MALQILWFVLWGVLWGVYFMLDGFDFGAVMLRNFLAHDEIDRRVALTSIGPVWDGNEVWLITAGGATFAAFPVTYASMFSFLYLAMLLILFSLIVRGVAVEYRGKSEALRWRSMWDWAMAIASLSASFLFGLAFGNIFRGLAFDASGYHGTFGGLWNGYGILTGLLFVVVFLQHGALWLAVKSEGDLAARAHRLAGRLWFVLLAIAALFLVASAFASKLIGNYLAHPVLLAVPLLAVCALLVERLLIGRPGAAGASAAASGPAGRSASSEASGRKANGRLLWAFFASCATILLVVATGLVGLYPNLIPSTLDPAANITIFNSSSGAYTLRVMTVVACIFVPIVIVYQLLVYRFFRGRVSRVEVAEETEGY